MTRFWHRLPLAARLANLSIRSRMLLPPLVAMVVLGPLLHLHSTALHRGQTVFAERLRQEQAVLDHALRLPEHLMEATSGLYRLAPGAGAAGAGGEAGRAAARATAERALERLAAEAAALEGAGLAEAERLGRAAAAHAQSVGRALERIERRPGSAPAAVRQTERRADALALEARALAAQTRRSVKALTAGQDAAMRRALRLEALTAIGAALVLLLAALMVSRSIARPLERLLEAIRRLRRGDLGPAVPMTGRRDELGEVARAVAQFRDILIERRVSEEERERQRRVLDHMAHHDTLTGLPNRPLAERFVDRALRDRRAKGAPVALLVIDLDAFKPINDTHGHAAGDAVLVEIARRLEAVVRGGDLAARIGGDEFAVVLAGVQRREDVERLAERVASVFAEPVEWQGRSLLIGGSIGGALTTDAGRSVEALFAAADAAMYAAKQDPPAPWSIFVPPDEAQAEARRRDRPALVEAIRSRQTLPCFQPVVRLPDRGLAGFVVQPSWRHPEKGFVPVREFLPEVEKEGLVAQMTLAGFGDLLGTLAGWFDEGLDPGRTSVIPPPAMLASEDGMQELDALLARFPRTAGGLTVEVPEGALRGRGEAAILRGLGRLRERRVRTALSGFGGHDGALAVLRRGVFDEIRLSSSLVAEIGTDPAAELLIGAFATVAAGLGIDVMARGVETVEQERRLSRLGCRFATGALYGDACFEPEQARERLGAAAAASAAGTS